LQNGVPPKITASGNLRLLNGVLPLLSGSNRRIEGFCNRGKPLFSSIIIAFIMPIAGIFYVIDFIRYLILRWIIVSKSDSVMSQ